MAEHYKGQFISDEELATLAKFLTQQEMSVRLNLSQQRISQRLAEIKKQRALNTKEKRKPVKINPKKVSTQELLELASTILITEQDKDICSKDKIEIGKALGKLASTRADIMKRILEEKAVKIIIEKINFCLKEADPIAQQKFWGLISADPELAWIMTGKEPSEEPPTLDLREEPTKKEDKENKDPTAKFDEDLL